MRRSKEPLYEMSAAQYRGEGTEPEWRRTVKDALRHHGWTILLELPDSGMSALHALANGKRGKDKPPGPKIPALIKLLAAVSGWPDLTVGHPVHGLIFIELKTTTGTVRKNQRDMHALLLACRQHVYVWRTGAHDMPRILSGGPDMTIDT